MDGKIDVVLVEPGKPAVMAEIGSDLNSLQRAVGGSIEAAYFYDDPIAIVCNEDGKNIGLPMNRAVKDENGEIIGYRFIHFGKMMDMIKKGIAPAEALEKATGQYGRFDDAVRKIDPRHE